MLFPPPVREKAPRVVITGAGTITALGTGFQANSEAFQEGRCAFRPVSLFDVSKQRCQIAGESDLPDELPPSRLTRRETQRLDRAAKMLLHAAHEAWRQAGWADCHHYPIVLGTTSGGMTLGEDYYRHALKSPDKHRLQPTRVVQYLAQQQAFHLAKALGARGSLMVVSNACATGSNAIGLAFEMIRSGQAERVLTGGFDALCQLVFAGFDSLQALSTSPCKPFDARRDGLTLGEGAAIFALETADCAGRRGAAILAEIVGYGVSTDIHHLTQPHPEGLAALESMERACASAGVQPSQIDYVNAHGTGTPLNDSSEALALLKLAGAGVERLAVSSTKSSIGHLLGAAGAVEAAVCIMALQGQWVPPNLHLQTPDPVVRFEVVTRSAPRRVEYALSNSFGFGGSNATLIFRKWG